MRPLVRTVRQVLRGRCVVFITIVAAATAAGLLVHFTFQSSEIGTVSNVVLKLRGAVAGSAGGSSRGVLDGIPDGNENKTVGKSSREGGWMDSISFFSSGARNKTTNVMNVNEPMLGPDWVSTFPTTSSTATEVANLPPWTHLPMSQFTDHVLRIIDDLNLTQVSHCPHHYTLSVATSHSIPRVECQLRVINDIVWCRTLQRIFESRPIPYNVSIGFVLSESFEPDDPMRDNDSASSACLGNSSPGGKLVVPNKADIHEMLRMQGRRETNPDYEYRWQFRVDIPWEERHSIPIYRGKASLISNSAKWGSATNIDCSKLWQSPRYQAVAFSTMHPTLLDARFSQLETDVQTCLEEYSKNNGLDPRLLTDGSIPKQLYFTNYQVALVLAAEHAAAFRTAIHLMTGTAVVLQDCVYQEWYTKYLEPYVHYIPVSADLHDLNETLHWIQDHPAEVKAIAGQGRSFWEKYLTFQGHEEHLFELVYRLSEYNYYLSSNDTTHSMSAPQGLTATQIRVAEFDSKQPVPNGTVVLGTRLNPSLPTSPSEVFQEAELPIWSSLPRSPFTENVLGIINDIKLSDIPSCDVYYSLFVTSPNSIPTVQCQPDVLQDAIWCNTLRRIFELKPLAYNVSLGFLLTDFFDPAKKDGNCIGNSSPGGKMVMPNMEDIQQMRRAESARKANPEQYRWPYKVDVPWEQRSTIPVFRGTAWSPHGYRLDSCLTPRFDFSVFWSSPRYKAVAFSKDNPSLLDAKFARIDWVVASCFAQNATNGFGKILPIDSISNYDYFANYQVALVLSGIGAAFRLSNHLMTGTAVVLQDFVYQEWYTKYLEPYVHYIPVSADLHDLNETLHWIQDHPAEVKAIAGQGRSFWEKYLTFQGHEEHIYELAYRLSEYNYYLSTNDTIQRLTGAQGRVTGFDSVNPAPSSSLVPGAGLNPSLPTSATEVVQDVELPIWSSLPKSPFTEHVLGIINDINLPAVSSCAPYYSLFVTSPNSIPTIQCQPENPNDFVWCDMLRRVFEAKPLAYNVSLGFDLGDYFDPAKKDGSCIGNSSPGGKMVMPNMEDIQQMRKDEFGRNVKPEDYRWPYKVDVPWEQRNTVPVFRGTAWSPPGYELDSCLNPTFDFSVFWSTPRYKAVAFSKDNPSLLDAKFSVINWLVESCFAQNATNGFDQVLPIEYIWNDDYFANYQVALVLSGIGAAFRTAIHLMTGTAVVLQDCVYQEWFTKYLEPYVHYIPVSADLHDLNETLHWIQDHPAEVKAIAGQGRSFWEKYLTFQRHEEHIYELAYRLSEYAHYRDATL